MRRMFFPIHIDGDNRGCEAIARGTVKVLNLNKQEYIGFSKNIEIDYKLGLDNILTLVPRKDKSHCLFQRAYNRVARKFNITSIHGDPSKEYKRIFDCFLSQITKDDLCFITGGDMFCYENNELNYIINTMHNSNITTVLWGCSFGPENLTNEKLFALKRISIITTREELTYNYFTKELKLNNVHLVADPAFTLIPEEIELPDYFDNNVLGINVSNFTSEKYSDDNVFFKSFIGFVEYVLEKTDLTIVLIPHVFWRGQDDRIVCKMIKDKIKNERIKILDSEKMNYCQIRFIISKCKFFIGARTHAMISAYSTLTPALALGYSIKSIGIARDLALDDKLVLDYRKVANSDDIIDRFEYVIANEKNIREHLESAIPEYINRAYLARELINNL